MEKSRHGCLTAWLIIMLIANLIVLLNYLGNRIYMDTVYGTVSDWAVPTMMILTVFNLVCVVGLFYWKKLAFWGVCISALAAFCVNLTLGPAAAIPGLAGPLILFGVLKIGQRNGWEQLD